MANLEAFFASIRSLLEGAITAEQVQTQLGGGVGGELDYYRQLYERNRSKILGDLFASVRSLVRQSGTKGWSELVNGYSQSHPPSHRDPNHFGNAFPEFLEIAPLPEVVDRELAMELADYCWIRRLASVALEDGTQGFEKRLFVRHYAFPIVAYSKALLGDPGVPAPAQQPEIVLVYRDRQAGVRVLRPTALELAAIATRQGSLLPPAWAKLSPTAVADADRRLLQRGVFVTEGS